MLLNNPESLTILIVEIPKLEQEMCSCIKVTDFMTADFMTLHSGGENIKKSRQKTHEIK